MTLDIRKTSWRSAALVLVSLLALSGCSSAPAPTDSAFKTVEAGTLTCAMSGEYRPFNYIDESGAVVGFDVDICKGIAKELGLKAAPVTGPFNALIAGVTNDRYDAIIGSMATTEERQKQVDFSVPYYKTGAQLFVADSSSVTGSGDLKDAKIGVALGTTFEEYARELPGVTEVKTYQADVDALRDLQQGRIDAVITQGFMGLYLSKNANLKVKPVGDYLFDDIAAIPINKGNPELLTGINNALETMHEDGSYAEISTHWFGKEIG